MKKVFISILGISFIFLISACHDASDHPVSPAPSADLNKKGSSFALEFDGTDGYVEVPDDASLDMTNEVTIAAWIYFNNDGYPPDWSSVATKGGEKDGDGGVNINNYTLHFVGERFVFTGHTTGGFVVVYSDNEPLTTETWHHVAVTFRFDGTSQEVKFYIDGADAGVFDFYSDGPPSSLISNDESLTIGADFPLGDEYWYGKIDEVKVWNEALKPAHIRASMRGSATPLARALAGHWTFNEGRGTTVKDKSRNKNNGTLLGSGVAFLSPGVH